MAASVPLLLLALLLATPLGAVQLPGERTHIAFISAAVVISLALAVLAAHAFLAGGYLRHLALASGFLAFSAIYAWHGIHTGIEPAVAWLIYGPISRVAFGLALLGVASHHILAPTRRGPLVLVAVASAGLLGYISWLMHPVLIAWGTETTPANIQRLRFALESTGILLASIAIWRLLNAPAHTPHLVVIGAIGVAAQGGFFLFAQPWNLVWWAAHAVGAVATTLLAIGLVVVVRQVQHQTALASIKREAEVRQAFLNNAAHALRTPLTPLSLQLHLLEQKLADHPAAETVQKAKRATKRLTAIVDEMLLAAEASAPRSRTAATKPIDLAILADDVASDMEQAANAKGLQLLVDAKSCRVTADEQKVRKVLKNLVDNAIRYTPTGHVVVTVRPTQEGGRVSVQDTGMGVDSEDLKLLFTPFGRPSTAQNQSGGQGLSLAVCRVILASFGGAIDARSDGLGHGLTVTFTIPYNGANGTPA